MLLKYIESPACIVFICFNILFKCNEVLHCDMKIWHKCSASSGSVAITSYLTVGHCNKDEVDAIILLFSEFEYQVDWRQVDFRI
jgi:hypothetical protein